MQVHYLPPNTTSVLQPMDQGIIQALKTNYRKRLLAQRIGELRAWKEASPDKPFALRPLSILEVMHLAAAAWDAVSSKTINLCWGKANIVPPAFVPRPTDVPNRPADWQELEESVQTFLQLTDGDSEADRGNCARRYVNIDSGIECTETMTKDDILEQLQAIRQRELAGNDAPAREDGDEDDEDLDVPTAGVPVRTMCAWARTIQRFVIRHATAFDEDTARAIEQVRGALDRHAATAAMKQTAVTDFFKPITK